MRSQRPWHSLSCPPARCGERRDREGACRRLHTGRVGLTWRLDRPVRTRPNPECALATDCSNRHRTRLRHRWPDPRTAGQRVYGLTDWASGGTWPGTARSKPATSPRSRPTSTTSRPLRCPSPGLPPRRLYLTTSKPAGTSSSTASRAASARSRCRVETGRDGVVAKRTPGAAGLDSIASGRTAGRAGPRNRAARPLKAARALRASSERKG